MIQRGPANEKGRREKPGGPFTLDGDQVPGLRAGRLSHMNEIAGTRNVDDCGVLVPATERGNTIAVIADPATVVPGVASQSRPTVQPSCVLPFGLPTRAIGSTGML